MAIFLGPASDSWAPGIQVALEEVRNHLRSPFWLGRLLFNIMLKYLRFSGIFQELCQLPWNDRQEVRFTVG